MNGEARENEDSHVSEILSRLANIEVLLSLALDRERLTDAMNLCRVLLEKLRNDNPDRVVYQDQIDAFQKFDELRSEIQTLSDVLKQIP